MEPCNCLALLFLTFVRYSELGMANNMFYLNRPGSYNLINKPGMDTIIKPGMMEKTIEIFHKNNQDIS